MYRIAVYFDQPGKMDYPFDSQRYFEAYAYFAKRAAQKNVEVYIVRGESYLGGMTFKSGWQFKGSELFEVPSQITVDLVYVKGLGDLFRPTKDAVVLDDPAFDALTANKWETYKVIGTYMPQTVLVENNEWEKAAAEFSTDNVVFKPVNGAGGRGVKVWNRKDSLQELQNVEEPYIAQAYIDATHGIPGLTTGLHDLRVLVFENTPKLTYLRIPAEGSMLANVALGGTVQVLDYTQLPEKVDTIVNKVAAQFSKYIPKVYAIDFMFEKDAPYIIEVNTRPGFPNPAYHGVAYVDTFYDSLLEVMISEIKRTK